MALATDGQLGKWLVAGEFWAAACWFFFAFCMVIVYREIGTSIPAGDLATLPQRLANAVKRLHYAVQQESPTQFVCQPARGFARVISLECTKLHVEVQDDRIDLNGPAFVVNRVRKQLLKT